MTCGYQGGKDPGRSKRLDEVAHAHIVREESYENPLLPEKYPQRVSTYVYVFTPKSKFSG